MTTPSSEPSSRPPWGVLLGLFGMAAAPRLLYLGVMRPGFEGYHWYVADNLLQYGSIGLDGIKSSVYEPLYPVFLAAARVLSGDTVTIIQGMQLAIDSIGAVLLYLLIDALTGRRRAAFFGAALYSSYPLLIRHSVTADEFSLQSVLLIAFAYAIVTACPERSRRATAPVRAAAAGLWLGLAMLTRVMVAPVLALTTLWLMMRRRDGTAIAAITAIAFLAAALIVISPWLIRNYSVGGTVLPTKSGENLFHGNSRYTAALLPAHNLDLLGEYGQALAASERPALLEPNAEAELDQFYTALAWQEIKARPLETLQLKFRNVAYFFWPRLVPYHVADGETRLDFGTDGQVRVLNARPRSRADSLVYTVSYSLVALAALVGIWIRRSHLRDDAVLWAIVVTFVATHVVYFPATRYRVPMEFVLLFYAAVALDAWLPERAKGLPS